MSLVTGPFERALIQPGSVSNSVVDGSGVSVLVGASSGGHVNNSTLFTTAASVNLPVPGANDPTFFYMIYTRAINEGSISIDDGTLGVEYEIRLALGTGGSFFTFTQLDSLQIGVAGTIGKRNVVFQLLGFWEIAPGSFGPRPALLQTRRLSGNSPLIRVTNMQVCAVRLK